MGGVNPRNTGVAHRQMSVWKKRVDAKTTGEEGVQHRLEDLESDSPRLRGVRCSNWAPSTLGLLGDAATASAPVSVKHYGSPCPGLIGWWGCWQPGLAIWGSVALRLISPVPGQGRAALKFCLEFLKIHRPGELNCVCCLEWDLVSLLV